MSHYHGRGKVSSKNSRVALERMVDLSDLAYLGTMVSQLTLAVWYGYTMLMKNCYLMWSTRIVGVTPCIERVVLPQNGDTPALINVYNFYAERHPLCLGSKFVICCCFR